jgi:hypothetical protein
MRDFAALDKEMLQILKVRRKRFQLLARGVATGDERRFVS